jgi:hypothetical protein
MEVVATFAFTAITLSSETAMAYSDRLFWLSWNNELRVTKSEFSLH